MERTDIDEAALKVFGSNIRTRRATQGLSQEQLAEVSGLDRTYVGGAERGERNLSLLNIIRIARALGVTPRDLLEGVR